MMGRQTVLRRLAEYEATRPPLVYGRAPQLVYWEATRACELACIHCRADAVLRRSPDELTTAEAQRLLDQIAVFGGPRLPQLVITGGDPLQRPDLFDLIAYGRGLGLSISVTPAGTARLTPALIDSFRQASVNSLALSLDGSDAARHDAFRRVAGSYDWTISAAQSIVAAGIPLQVNTMVTAATADDLPAIYDRMVSLGITRWALFFLISTGRGQGLAEVTPRQSERYLNWVWQRAADPATPFAIKTTEAHHYRRIAFTKLARHHGDADIAARPVGRGFGIRDGNGIVFISHTGEVYPSGFLPLTAGNVRESTLAALYRDHPLFRSLRDPDQLKGKCGVCPFRRICGGSRARAYAVTGDPLGSDPLCPYQPVH